LYGPRIKPEDPLSREFTPATSPVQASIEHDRAVKCEYVINPRSISYTASEEEDLDGIAKVKSNRTTCTDSYRVTECDWKCPQVPSSVGEPPGNQTLSVLGESDSRTKRA
jgi:hypothetical protein